MNRLSDTLSRRRLLQSGGHAWLSGSVSGAVCGTLAAVAAQQQSSASSPFAPESLSASFGRAKSIIWLYLSGGPSQYETFDPKPNAPAEIRGSFSPIATRMKDVLCPQFDQGFTALIEDLETRGLLDHTHVVAIGEMGRTAKFNASGGRDHWGNVFSFVLAGAGIRVGQAYGSSDRTGAWPATDRTTPPQLTATILHLLGVSHEAMFPDPAGRPLRAVEGEPIAALL